MTKEKQYSIKELADKVDLSTCYIRRMIHQGKLESEMVPFNSKQKKHMITMEQFKTFRAKTKVRTTREDGRNKYKAYFTPKEFERIQKLLVENELDEIADLIERANKSTS